ncbi:MAG TPA: hypothetical protein VFG50_11500 [Rhodothermales bacterium]|nr:hypothetical protein [Rhodothermales bacterium]
MIKVLIICRDRESRRRAWLALQAEDYYVQTAQNEEEAQEALQVFRPDVVVLSPGMRMVVAGVRSVVRLLDDQQQLLQAVRWAAAGAREPMGR